jgi:hypothetical protein
LPRRLRFGPFRTKIVVAIDRLFPPCAGPSRRGREKSVGYRGLPFRGEVAARQNLGTDGETTGRGAID